MIGIDCSFQEGRDVLVDSRLSGKQHSWMGWDGMGCVVQMGSMHAWRDGGMEGGTSFLPPISTSVYLLEPHFYAEQAVLVCICV